MDGLAIEYPTIFPVEYYKNLVDKERARSDEAQQWYLRPHHIETLTEHPASLKDNILDSNYYSFYTELEKDRDGRFISVEESEARKQPTQKDILIGQLENQIADLRSKISHIAPGQTGSYGRPAGAIPVHEMEKYYLINKQPETIGADPMSMAFESVMDNLRQQEKSILNKKRDMELEKYRTPDPSWYTSKTHNFTAEMKKYDTMMKRDPQREEKLRKLMNKELY
jgi:hypothetical protein